MGIGAVSVWVRQQQLHEHVCLCLRICVSISDTTETETLKGEYSKKPAFCFAVFDFFFFFSLLYFFVFATFFCSVFAFRRLLRRTVSVCVLVSVC